LAQPPVPQAVPTVTKPVLKPTEPRINVYWHVIRSGNGTAQGNITDAQIASQMEVLNTAFTAPSFSFNLVATDRTTNATWFNASVGSSAESEMKDALHQGTASDLNVYSLRVGGGMLGWGSLPSSYTSWPSRDGVIVLDTSLPSGNAAPYNLGDTLVMHVGTWLGLVHPFIGGCSGDDGVSDTPATREAAYGCPANRDSCPNKPGSDLIQNYMDYTDDSCKTSFTPGQYERMKSQYATYRKAG
jgi:hypothetical protein